MVSQFKNQFRDAGGVEVVPPHFLDGSAIIFHKIFKKTMDAIRNDLELSVGQFY
jgi:hypothetical protein